MKDVMTTCDAAWMSTVPTSNGGSAMSTHPADGHVAHYPDDGLKQKKGAGMGVERRARIGRPRQSGPRPTERVGYDPDSLLNALIEVLKLKNDAALARALHVMPPVISKIRHRKLAVGPSLLVRMHELTGLHVRDLRGLMTVEVEPPMEGSIAQDARQRHR